MNILKTLFGFRTLEAAAARAHNYYGGALHEIDNTNSVPVLSEYARDSSGYVRQAVLKRCVALARPELLAVVVGRLNDWVPQVRDAARIALMTLLPFVPVPQLMAALPAILRLHSDGRGDYSEWLAKFEQTLLQFVTVSDICSAARSTDIKAARAAVHLLDKHALLETSALVELILERRDDIVLALKSMALCAKLGPDRQRILYGTALHWHFGAVRTIALRALLNLQEVPHSDIAILALTDAQSSVRHIAAQYLGAKGFDVPSHYRDLLVQASDNAKRLQVSLGMLAVLQDTASLSLIKSFAHHDHASVRVAALSSWFKLAEWDKDEIAMTALHDASPRVLKFAALMVRRHGAYIPFAAIVQQLEISANVLALLRIAETNRWNWLECLARACLQRGVEEAHRAPWAEALNKWLEGMQWHDFPDQQQRAFLLSEPVMAAFGQLLSPQRLAFLRTQLLR